MPIEIQSGLIAGIRQDTLLFLAVVGSAHFVLMAIATTFGSWGENAGRRLFISLGVAGSCVTVMLFLELVAFVWAPGDPTVMLAGDLMRLLAATALLWAGCALSPKFTWGCAVAALAAAVLIILGLGLGFGLRGISMGTGVAVFGAAAGLVVHILRFQGARRLTPGARIPLCLAAGSFCLFGVDGIVRQQASWGQFDPWLILPAITPWAAGLALWVFNDGVKPIARLKEVPAPQRLFSLWFFPLVQALILLVGCLGIELVSRPATTHAMEHLSLHMRAASSSVNPILFSRAADRDLELDGDVSERLGAGLDSIIQSVPDCDQALLWRTTGNVRSVVVEAKSDDAAELEFPASPSARELQAILAGEPVSTLIRAENGELRLLASAPVYAEYSDRLIGWLSLVMKPDSFVAMIMSRRTGMMVVIGLLSMLGTGLFALYVRGQIENDLKIGKEKAEVADRAKSEFLAIMSHEIRTPLQSVLGYADLVIDTPLDESQRNHIQLIRNQGQTLMRIVQDVLEFSAMRRGNFSLQLKPVLLRALVEEVAGSVSPLADRKGLRFDLTVSDDLPGQIQSDSVRLRQVLNNLIGNAIKYTQRGRIVFDVRPDPLESSVESEGGGRVTVVFRVTDTGSGIPDHAKKRLFEPFFRSEPDFAAEEGGAGLGLAIVKRLCELMGASIRIESQLGQGTTIEVRVPFEVTTVDLSAAQSLLPSWDAEDASTPPVLAWELPLSILLVEDNSFIQGLFLEYLRKLGYQPDAVGSGRDAVAAFLQIPYDLVLMDLKLPELSGPEAVREIRRISKDDESPWIIGLSASTREEDVNEALDAGMNDFLAKPVNLRGLLETILFSPLGQSLGESREVLQQVVAADDVAEELSDVVGAPSRQRAFALFTRETPAIVEEMREAYEAADLLKVRNRAHYLKNSGLYLKETGLVELCETLCSDATKARHREVGVGLNALEDLVVSIMLTEAVSGS